MDTIDLDQDNETPKANWRVENGKRATGMPKGISTPKSDKRTYDDDELAQHFAEKLLNGGPLPTSRAGPPTQRDREHVARITGVTVEEFQAKFLQRLMTIADKAANHIEERLDEGGQRLSDLNMTLAISVDKMAAISGRTAQSGNVSVTVNNYGAMSREQMLASVEKERNRDSIEIESQVRK